MLQAGHFPGQSPSRLLHRCGPHSRYNPCKPHLLSGHLAVHRLLSNLEAFLEIRCHTLLWSSYGTGTLPPAGTADNPNA